MQYLDIVSYACCANDLGEKSSRSPQHRPRAISLVERRNPPCTIFPIRRMI